MGFGIDIGGAIKSAVKSAGDLVSGAAHKAQEVEQKAVDTVKSAWDKITDGFDHPEGKPVADSKPKGGSGTNYA